MELMGSEIAAVERQGMVVVMAKIIDALSVPSPGLTSRTKRTSERSEVSEDRMKMISPVPVSGSGSGMWSVTTVVRTKVDLLAPEGEVVEVLEKGGI
jgi:hypothetical protein